MAVAQDSSIGVSAQVDGLFARYDRDDSPGAAVGVFRRGEVVLDRYYGMADLEHGVKIGPDSVFDIASISKQFAAAAIRLLADRGELDLDDPIQAYLPEIPEYEDPITVRHLVHHTSGIRDHIGLRMLAGYDESDHVDMQDVLDQVAAQQGLNFPPGSKHLYCNSGYVLLAIIVSRLSGQSFGDWCKANLFEPLGMTSTHFNEDVQRVEKGLVQMYFRNAEGELRKDVPNDDVVGDGGLLSTLHDLAKWDGNFYTETVGGPGFAERMAVVGTPEDSTDRYAFGLSVGEYRGLRTVSHGGNLNGFSGEFMRFPEQGLSVVVLSNLGAFDSGGLARKVAALYLEDEMGPDEDAPPATTSAGAAPETTSDADLSVFAGLFLEPDTGLLLDVIKEDTGLVAVAADQRIPMTHRHDALFNGEYQEITLGVEFDVTDEGKPEKLKLIYNGEPLITAGAIQPVHLEPVELEAYVGDFYSEETGLGARVRAQGGKLYLWRGKAKRDSLRPTLPDQFAFAYGGVRFTREDAGKVDGFAASMSRTTGVLYRRVSP